MDLISTIAENATKAHDRGEITDEQLCAMLEACINARAVEGGYADQFGVPFPSTNKEKKTMLQVHNDTHLDHGISGRQLEYTLKLFERRTEFFLETIELPEELGTVMSALYGPAAGDEPIGFGDPDVLWCPRGSRPYLSRMIARPPRQTRQVTVIAGPHDGHPCVLYTVFGGPATPKEPTDPTIKPDEMDKAYAFWLQHALAMEGR